MPLELPNLDDRRYADLVEEARRLIPSLDSTWTDHNPSDPGITLIELFASLSEILLYRLNRVTEANQARFLKLLQGPDWTPSPGGDLTADTRQAVRAVRARFRAVSAADYERIALEDFNDWLAEMQRAELAGDTAALRAWWDTTRLAEGDEDNLPSKVPPVGRARCVPGKNLERGTELERTQPDPGHVSLMVVPLLPAPPPPPAPQTGPLLPPAAMTTALWGFLDERRVLTTRHHVVGVSHAPVSAEIIVARTSDAVESNLRARIVQALEDFLDPLEGGPEGEGWPFGRNVYVSELVEQLEGITGVDFVTDVMLESACPGGAVRCVPAPLSWHAEGDLIGLALAHHHLPKAGIDPDRIVIAPGAHFLPVTVTVGVNPTAGEDLAGTRRKVKAAVRSSFHPRSGGPGPATTSDTEILIADLHAVLDDIPVFVSSLELEVSPDRLLRNTMGVVTGFLVKAGEVVNWRTVVNT